MRFFATAGDVQPIIQSIEESKSLAYYEAGLFDSQTQVLYSSLVATPTFDKPVAKAAVHCTRYMVLASPASLRIRTIPQKAGGCKYAVDQLINPESLIIQLGGVHQEGVLISSSIGATLPCRFTTSLTSAYRHRFNKNFRKMTTGIYIGSEAEHLSSQGWRLTDAVNQPQEYDIQKEAPRN